MDQCLCNISKPKEPREGGGNCHIKKDRGCSLYLSGVEKWFWYPGGGTLGISGWGCAAGTLEAYTRASSGEFCYPILDPNVLIYIPNAGFNCLKTISFTAAHTYIAHIWQ